MLLIKKRGGWDTVERLKQIIRSLDVRCCASKNRKVQHQSRVDQPNVERNAQLKGNDSNAWIEEQCGK